MNESTKRSWEKTAQLEAKTFEFASHKTAEIHLYQLTLYSFPPGLSQENSPPYLLVMSTFLLKIHGPDRKQIKEEQKEIKTPVIVLLKPISLNL